MKDRILKILDKENISAAKFADVLGVQRSSISHILSGRNKPSLDFVQRILQKFPEINSDWLLFGKGNIYRNGSGQSEQQSQQVAPTTEKPKAQPQQPEPQPQPQPANQQQPSPLPPRRRQRLNLFTNSSRRHRRNQYFNSRNLSSRVLLTYCKQTPTELLCSIPTIHSRGTPQ